jgi:Undecaprenyl-phosphate galactose phosphotransferase WbaP
MHGVNCKLSPNAQRVKKGIDFLLIMMSTIILIPIFLLIVLLLRIDSMGPIFYGHKRLGKNGTYFKAWKFRSMVQNADIILKEYIESDPKIKLEWETNFKLKNDPRITHMGKFLRKTSLDELPQLWNVLRGEMSLVGPRPIVDAEKIKYGDSYTLFSRVRPGMTGLWQISGRSDTGYDERVRLDVKYIMEWSLFLDLYIFIKTIGAITKKTGAY